MRVSVIILLVIICASGVEAQITSAKWKIIEAEGDTLMNSENFAGALEKYNKVIEISKLRDRESKPVLYKRAVCYYSLGEFQKALDDLAVFIPEFSSFPQGHILRAYVHRELGDTDGQLEDINKLISMDPVNPGYLQWRAGLYLQTDKFQEAKKELLLISQLSNNEEIETQLGFTYYNLSNPDSAILHFENALNLNAGYAPAYGYAASLCLEQEAYDMALTYADIGLMIEPQNQTMLFYKGIALAEKDNLDEACSILSKLFYGGMDEAGGYLKQYCYSAKN